MTRRREHLLGEPTYPEVGATIGGPLPEGYDLLRRSRVIGHGGDDFAQAAESLMTWQMHRRAGLAVAPSTPRATAGTNVVLTLTAGPARITAPCRVVHVTDTSAATGFAYGTLPGHLECGEESFTVRLAADGQVSLNIVAFSRPALWYSRLFVPVSRLVQHRIIDRYLNAACVGRSPALTRTGPARGEQRPGVEVMRKQR